MSIPTKLTKQMQLILIQVENINTTQILTICHHQLQDITHIQKQKRFILVAGLEQFLQYNQYNIGPRLIVIAQAIRDKRIPKFICSGWEQFKSLGMAQTVCQWRVTFFQQQVVQARGFTQCIAPEEPFSQLSTSWLRCVLSTEYQCHSSCSHSPRILFSSLAAVWAPVPLIVLPWGSNDTPDTGDNICKYFHHTTQIQEITHVSTLTEIHKYKR